MSGGSRKAAAERTARLPGHTTDGVRVLPPATEGGERDQSEALVRAAVTLFAARGFHAVTTRDIASAAGLSPAALYVHYPSKAELLYEIVIRAHVAGFRVMQEAWTTASRRGPAQRLRSVVAAQVRFNAEWREHAHVGNFEFMNLDEDPRKEVLALRRRTEQLVRGTLEEGVESGVFKPGHIELATTAILSLAVDVSRWYSPRKWSAAALADAYADIALRIAGGRARRPAGERATGHTPNDIRIH